MIEETVRIYFCKLTPLRNMERILLGKDMFITQMCNYNWHSSRSEIITVCIKIALYSLLNNPVILIDDEIQRGIFLKKVDSLLADVPSTTTTSQITSLLREYDQNQETRVFSDWENSVIQLYESVILTQALGDDSDGVNTDLAIFIVDKLMSFYNVNVIPKFLSNSGLLNNKTAEMIQLYKEKENSQQQDFRAKDKSRTDLKDFTYLQKVILSGFQQSVAVLINTFLGVDTPIDSILDAFSEVFGCDKADGVFQDKTITKEQMEGIHMVLLLYVYNNLNFSVDQKHRRLFNAVEFTAFMKGEHVDFVARNPRFSRPILLRSRTSSAPVPVHSFEDKGHDQQWRTNSYQRANYRGSFRGSGYKRARF